MIARFFAPYALGAAGLVAVALGAWVAILRSDNAELAARRDALVAQLTVADQAIANLSSEIVEQNEAIEALRAAGEARRSATGDRLRNLPKPRPALAPPQGDTPEARMRDIVGRIKDSVR